METNLPVVPGERSSLLLNVNFISSVLIVISGKIERMRENNDGGTGVQ